MLHKFDEVKTTLAQNFHSWFIPRIQGKVVSTGRLGFRRFFKQLRKIRGIDAQVRSDVFVRNMQ